MTCPSCLDAQERESIGLVRWAAPAEVEILPQALSCPGRRRVVASVVIHVVWWVVCGWILLRAGLLPWRSATGAIWCAAIASGSAVDFWCAGRIDNNNMRPHHEAVGRVRAVLEAEMAVQQVRFLTGRDADSSCLSAERKRPGSMRQPMSAGRLRSLRWYAIRGRSDSCSWWR